MTTRLRTRAAYLHIAKCAGTSVTSALTAAAGHPPQPEARLDSCYTFGSVDRSSRSDAARRMILDPADIDPSRSPGSHVFETHWSLPTLRTWFAPAEIATVLREPAMRLLSFVLFAHTRTQSQRRLWYPDDVGARMVRRPLAELLGWEPAARAIDNLAVRQVLWGDARIVGDEFIPSEHAGALSMQASTVLEELGFVGVIEASDHAVEGLGNWLGRPLDVGHSNRTVDVPYTGLVTPSTDLDEVHQLLMDRTVADRVVWANSARRCGIDPDDTSFERLVGERLRRLSSASSFALWSQPGPESESHGGVVADEPAIWDSAEAPAQSAHSASGAIGPSRVLVVGDHCAGVELDSIDGPIHSTHVRSAHGSTDTEPEPRPVAGSGFAFDRSVSVDSIDSVDLRALLAGHDIDRAIVVVDDRADLAATARQLADAVVPGGSLTLVGDTGAAGERVDARLWIPHSGDTFVRTDVIAEVERAEAVAAPSTPATMGAMDRADTTDWSRYGEAILLDNPTDSRAIVLGLLDGEPQRILELGSSAGLMTRVLHDRGHRVTGVEIDPVAADICRPFADRMLVGDLDTTGPDDLLGQLESASFDVLLAADVLEHLRNPIDALRRAVAKLAPDGTAILSIPNIAHGDVRLALLAGRFDYRSNGLLDRTHVQLFTLNSLTEMIRDAGLVPVSWLRSTRPVGTTEIEIDEALFEFGQRAFADDPEIDTYQWIVTCRRVDDPSAVADWPSVTDSPVPANVAPMLDVTVPRPIAQPSSAPEVTGADRSAPQRAAAMARPFVARARGVARRIIRLVKG